MNEIIINIISINVRKNKEDLAQKRFNKSICNDAINNILKAQDANREVCHAS